MATARVFRNDRACPTFGVDRELELAASLRPRHYAGRIAPHIGARIFSLTPSMADPDRRNGSRAGEVLAYLASQAPTERPGWVVIDDERSYADTTAAGWLILADGDEGFGECGATAGRSPRVSLTIEVPVSDMAGGDGAVQAETLREACAKEELVVGVERE
jgi:hypothetical protein